MTKVKIPECSNPFEVTINGRKYIYEAGIQTDVPDDVAKAIEKHKKAHYKDPPEAKAPFGAISFNNLKDKPLGEGEPIVVVPETTVTTGAEGVPIGDYTDLIKVGTTCIVTFNGTDYECVAYEFNIAPGVLIIGNANFLELGLDGGNEEPFVITNNAGAGLILGAGEGAVTVSVKAKPIITIDDKYLPETAIKTKYHSFALITVDLRQLISQYLYIDDLNVGNRTVSVPIDNFRFFQRAIEDCHLIYDGFIARFEGANGFTAEISCSLYYIGSSSIEWKELYFNFNYDAEKQMLTYSITATTKYTDFKQ